MLMHIVQGTPTAVWLMLAGLVAFGLAQARSRTISAARAGLLPLALLVLSLLGVASSFGLDGAAFAAWLAGITAAVFGAPAWLPPPRAQWEASGRRVHVDGSWQPLALMMGIFATKYAAGVALALQPALAAQAGFALPLSFAFGLFSGVFAARGLQLWRARRLPPARLA